MRARSLGTRQAKRVSEKNLDVPRVLHRSLPQREVADHAVTDFGSPDKPVGTMPGGRALSRAWAAARRRRFANSERPSQSRRKDKVGIRFAELRARVEKARFGQGRQTATTGFNEATSRSISQRGSALESTSSRNSGSLRASCAANQKGKGRPALSGVAVAIPGVSLPR